VRAVLDTNIWLGGLIKRGGATVRLLAAFRSGQFEAVTSQPLLDEIADVLSRPEIARKFAIRPEDRDELLLLLQERTHSVEIVGEIAVCRDPKDDMVIETAIRGGAELIVSRDKDLNDDPAVATFLAARNIRVVEPQVFLALLAPQA
jgi:putative PIN family toxin of toxin-antitoxin system